MLRKPCHPVFCKPDGSFFATFLPSKHHPKRKNPMSNIGEMPVLASFLG